MNIRKILMISKLVLVAILAYTLVTAVFAPTDITSIKAPASVVASSRSELSNSDNHSNLSAEDYAQIVQKNPFDGSTKLIAWVHPEGSDSQLFDPSVSPELGLALVGTISGSPTVARAIIKDLKTGVSELCKTGQVVGNCRIQSIHPDSITLLYDGKERILHLNYGFAGQAKSQQSLLESRHKSSKPTEAGSQSKLTQNGLQNQIQAVETMFEKAIIHPHIADGQVEGLKITGIENIKEAEMFGLKNGDVIRSVNGHRLVSKQQAYQVLKKARAQDIMSFELLRNNRTKELSFSLK
jgi:type II secretion system protein C